MSANAKRKAESAVGDDTKSGLSDAQRHIREAHLVFPGDVVPVPGMGDPGVKLRVGPGLVPRTDTLLATRCGIARTDLGKSMKRAWIDNIQKRYMPIAEDLVIGTVVEKHADNYRVDIGSAHVARLSALAFEGATKRNKPNIPVGGLVYARVDVANKDMEPELACTSPHFKKEWVTGQAFFGELTGGYVFECSLKLARALLSENCHVLQCLGKHIPFELAIGVNGRVYVNSTSVTNIILVSNAITNSEHMTKVQTKAMVETLVRSIQT